MKSAPSPEIDIPVSASDVFENFIAAEYAYFSPKGNPLCWPVTPYWYPERGVLAVATGLAYPNKADYAALNPHVALLFSDPTGSGVPGAAQVFVKGIATVLDEDLQSNTDRYVKELREKFLVARMGLNPITVKFLDFYLPRLWVEITPVSIELRVREPPRRRDSQEIPDHPPLNFGGRDSQEIPDRPSPLKEIDRRELHRVVDEHGEGVVIKRGNDGHPYMERASLLSNRGGVIAIDIGKPVRLEAPASPGLQESGYQSHRASAGGAAALSIHHHTLGGTHFRAYMVRGRLHENWLVAERLVGFFGNGFVFPLSVIPEIARLRRRLRKELDRRGWQMPQLRVP